jgi:hypothetical protein
MAAATDGEKYKPSDLAHSAWLIGEHGLVRPRSPSEDFADVVERGRCADVVA